LPRPEGQLAVNDGNAHGRPHDGRPGVCVSVRIHDVVVVRARGWDEAVEKFAEVAVRSLLELESGDPHRRVRGEHGARPVGQGCFSDGVARHRRHVDHFVVTLRGDGQDLGDYGHRGIVGTARTARAVADPLELADAVLDGFYQAAFRTYVERLRGPQGAAMADPPTELVPFLRFKAHKAVEQPQVRKALREVLGADDDLAAAVADDFAPRKGDHQPTMRVVQDAAEGGDLAVLGRLASAAAAMRPPGWEAVVGAAAAAAAAFETGWTAGAERESRARDAAERRGDRERAKLEARLRDVEEERAAAMAERDKLKSERAELRGAAAEAQHSAATAARRAEQATAAVDSLRSERGALAQRVSQLEAALRGQEDAASRRDAALTQQIKRLEASLIPDLEPHARRLEQVAADLRDAMSALQSPSDGRTARRRRRIELPKGLLAESAGAVLWALGQSGLLMLVDGYNVTRQDQRGWGDRSLGDQRENLFMRCNQIHRDGGADIRVVFDSTEPQGLRGRRLRSGVCVEFSGGPIADDRIVEIVESTDPEVPVVVVTSDRELRRRLGVHGVMPVRSDVFLEAIGAPLR